jgi:phospholipase C
VRLCVRTLSQAAAVFVLALGFGCGSASQPRVFAQQALPPLARTADQSDVAKYIKHVVIIIQENRSFDNFFAGYPGANAPTYGYGMRYGQRIRIPLHQITFEHGPNLSHLYEAAILDWNHGTMTGFSKWGFDHDDAAYAFVERSEVAPYWTMAQQYVLADHMFPTEFGPSWTGHMTLIAGTDSLTPRLALADFASGPYNSCDSPPQSRTTTVNVRRHIGYHTGPYPCFTQFATMASTLDAAGVSWKYYVTQVRHAGIWSPFEAIKYVRHGRDWHTDLVSPQNLVLTDVHKGTLASVSWVTPTKEDSDHPGSHSDSGPSWVSSIVNALGKSRYWNSTAIVVVWDDWGGFYDNLAPPQLDFRGLGIRVPCLIISSYAKQGYVSHTRYEDGSILKFIEQAFHLPPLGPTEDGYTDTRANSISDSFDFNEPPRAFKQIPARYPIERFLREPPSNEPVDDE